MVSLHGGPVAWPRPPRSGPVGAARPRRGSSAPGRAWPWSRPGPAGRSRRGRRAGAHLPGAAVHHPAASTAEAVAGRWRMLVWPTWPATVRCARTTRCSRRSCSATARHRPGTAHAGLAPQRLILASCESGGQVGYRGDEVLGFVSALLARGTAGILASTAAVPDVGGGRLMTPCTVGWLTVAPSPARFTGPAVAGHRGSGRFVNWCTFNAHGAA